MTGFPVAAASLLPRGGETRVKVARPARIERATLGFGGQYSIH